MRSGLLALGCLALALAPELASACSVCSSGREEETTAAFLGTTLLLSVLPLVLVGGGVAWLRRRIRARDSLEAGTMGVPKRRWENHAQLRPDTPLDGTP